MSDELYSNYVDREPHPKNAAFIKRWHARLLQMAIERGVRPSRLLEIGPGHGFFAEECRQRNIAYQYCDTSPAVHRKMQESGFLGHLGSLSELSRDDGFDVIWMSHVLEHAPSWTDARQLVSDACGLLSDGGCVVIVSPDILSWRSHFWDVDSSHGYPTSIRNVAQLLTDVGMEHIVAAHHRNGSSGFLTRAAMWLLSLMPHVPLDRVLTPSRAALRDGMFYSWKAVFGWRQIMVIGRRSH